MLPKSYLVFKWVVYSLATFFLLTLQALVLNQIRIWDLVPFLYPMLPAVLSMYEGPRRGAIFALVLGVICGLLVPSPFQGFFAIVFTVTALLSSWVAENLLAPGFLCGLLVSTLGLLLTGGLRILTQILAGGGYLELMTEIAIKEGLITLPMVAVVVPVYRAVHKRCAADY